MTRTVKVDLVAGTAGYNAPIEKSTATTLKLALASKQQEASAKEAAAATVKASEQIAIATRQAALTAAKAAAETAAGDEAQLAAKKAVEVATRDLAAQEKASAKAVAVAERDSAAAGREVVAAQKAIEVQSKATAEAYEHTGKKLMTAGAVMVGAVALVEKATNSFDVAMSSVNAHASATPQELNKLADAALHAGEATAFTATQAAGAEDELEKAGVSTADVLGGALAGSLNLAQAGNLDLAKSAGIASDEMNTFGLKGRDVGHIADVLASGANSSSAEVGSLAEGMSQAGLVAHQMGLSLEDTTGVLAAFEQHGLHGADAGTSFKTMLERLAAPTGAAADTMKNLGIQAYTADGRFVGITSVAGQLHDKLGPLAADQRNLALQTIFGSDAIRAATVLYGLGAQGMQGWIDQVDKSGAAQEMAAKQSNNLSGDLRQLKGSLDVALIQSGQGANSVLRDLTQTATGAVNMFTKLPKSVQEIATAFAGGGGATLLFVGGITTAAGKVGGLRKTLKEAETTAEGLKGGLAKAGAFLTGPWGLAIAGAATVVGVLVAGLGHAKVEVTDFTDAIKADGSALGQQTVAAVSTDLANRKLYDSFSKIGAPMDTVTKAAMGNADAMESLREATARAMKGQNSLAGIQELQKNLGLIEATANGLHDQQKAQLQANAATDEAAAAGAGAVDAQTQQAQTAKNLAVANMQQSAAARAAAEAAQADATGTNAATTAAKGSTSATKSSAAATKADETAKKAHTAAQKAAANAADASAKASAADAKASTSAANAADKGSYANSTAAGAAKSAADATKDKTKASGADTRASNAAETAAKAAARAHDADAKATASHAKASGADAQAQADAAEAAREAAFEHQIGAEALKAWAAAAKDTAHSSDVLDDSVSAEVSAMKDAQDQANGLRDALDALNGVHISAGRAAVEVQSHIADLTKAFAENGKTLDITTQAGRDNMQAIYDTADAINAHAQAVTQETGSVAAGDAALKASRDEFDKVLKKVGLTTEQIQTFNDTLLAIPPTKTVAIKVDIKDGMVQLKEFIDAAGNLTAVHISGTTGRAGLATGGRVVGGGTPTSDSVPTNLSRDEYVIKASAAARIGYAQLDQLNFGTSARTLVRAPALGSIGGTSPHAGGAAMASALELRFAGNTDQAMATAFMKLARDGKITAVLT